MTAAVIVISVLLFIFFLLLLPVTVQAEYTDRLYVHIKYLFVKIRLLPQKEKKKKKKKRKEESKEKKVEKEEEKKEKSSAQQIKEVLDKTGLGGFIEIIKSLAKIAKDTAFGVLEHTVIQRFEVNIKAAGEDAADCAVNYGYVCAAVYPACSLIIAPVKDCKNINIEITPDFNSRQSSVKCCVTAYISLFWLLCGVIKAAFRLLKQLINAKKQGIL